MRIFYTLLAFVFVAAACTPKSTTEVHPEFKSHFDEFHVKGSFLLYDFEQNKTIIYNEERCNKGFLPASTFKMVNTLVGLETGIIPNENFIIPWDRVSRPVEIWNKDHNLASAFKYSVVPWYQELARRIGDKKMNNWVNKTRFGDMDINKENIDFFWLRGDSRITSFEQLDFQKRLVHNQLPYSREHIELVKKIMILDRSPDYTFRGKTGWAIEDGVNIGWLVGYVENKEKKYAYVINVESEEEDATLFQRSRKEIVRKILIDLSHI